MLTEIVIDYLVVMSLLTFAAYGMDKRKAKKGQWRIPEKTLLLLAVLGGSLGALLGMYVFHHKTQKTKFVIGVPAIIAVQAAVAAGFLWLRP